MVCENIFQTLSILNRTSKGAEILREFSSHTMCHVSCVTCHMKRITYHVSPVACHLSKNFSHINFFFIPQKDWTKWRRKSVEGLVSKGPAPYSLLLKAKYQTQTVECPTFKGHPYTAKAFSSPERIYKLF